MAADEAVATMSHARRQGIVTAAVGLLASVLGLMIIGVALGTTTWSSPAMALLPWDALVWAAVVVFVLPLAGGDVRLAVAAVALAPLLATVWTILQAGAHGGVAVVAVAGWKAAALGCAAAAGAIAGVLDRRRRHPAGAAPAELHPDDEDAGAGASHQPAATPETASALTKALPVALLLALISGGALSLALPLGWFGVYFSIWDAAEPPTRSEITRYEWTALSSLTLLAVAVVLAFIRRRRGLAVTAAVAFGLAVLIAFVFQVPAGRFMPSPAPNIVDDRPVCFGTTGDCPGG